MSTIKLRRGTAAAWTSANPTLTVGEPGFETDTGKVKIGDGSTAWTSLSYVTSHLDGSVIDTGTVAAARLPTLDAISAPAADVSLASHKLTNVTNPTLAQDAATKTYVDGAIVAGGGLPDPSGEPDGEVLVTSSGTAVWASDPGGGGPGASELVYRYTVTGTDKASIDTGVDTPDAGSNDLTNGDLLEILVYARTDEAVANSNVAVIFNNDSGPNYDQHLFRAVNTTVSGVASNGRANTTAIVAGATATANEFGWARWTVPNYLGTVGFKVGGIEASIPDETAANMQTANHGFQWRSTPAIARVGLSVITSGKKLKVGSQLLIYKRLAS